MTTPGLHDFLDRGYFPRELPPPFNTEILADVIDAHAKSLGSQFTTPNKTAHLLTFNLARAGSLRRRLAIPNPIHQVGISQHLVRYWSSILTRTNRSTFSISGPTVQKARAVGPEVPDREVLFERVKIRTTSRYLLQADVSRFYGSIYTHSVPWAVHGKAQAKKDRKSKNIGNVADKWLQSAQDGQTLGIPIGPDTSFVIAELVMSAVDTEFVQRLGTSPTGFRRVDDYEFGFPTMAAAQGALGTLQEALREYELELNPQKTRIIEQPIRLVPSWTSELRDTPIRGKSVKRQISDLINFFDLAFVHARSNPDTHVLGYAVGRAIHEKIRASNWGLFQQLLLQCVVAEPGTIRQVVPEIMKYERHGYELNKEAIETVLNMQILDGAAKGHSSEIAWALWALAHFGLPIDNSAALAISRMQDSIVALLGLDCKARGLLPAGTNLSIWQDHMTEEGLYSEHWLLAYEAMVKGWLPSKNGNDYVSADPNFGFLKANGVSFYDPNRTVLPPVQAGSTETSLV